MKKGISVAIIMTMVILFSYTASSCAEKQVDINTASLKKLQEIYGIGPAYGERIINYREKSIFENLDELKNIKGIGEVTLKKIKNQDKACIRKENNKNSSKERIKTNPIKINNPKDIKTPYTDYKSVVKQNTFKILTIYGIFIVLLCALTYLRKKYREGYKNEFG